MLFVYDRNSLLNVNHAAPRAPYLRDIRGSINAKALHSILRNIFIEQLWKNV